MILFLNGAFGSGKTTTAYELHKRLPDSFVFDMENFGYFLRKNMPNSIQKTDFQDEPIWRKVNFELLYSIASDYHGTVIVPMTITNEGYYAEIISALRNAGIRVDHYVLSASETTLHRRLNSRLESKNSWSRSHIESCIRAFQNPVFENKIETDNLTVSQVCEAIAENSELKIREDNRKGLIKWFSRKFTLIKKIRF